MRLAFLTKKIDIRLLKYIFVEQFSFIILFILLFNNFVNYNVFNKLINIIIHFCNKFFKFIKYYIINEII